MNDITLTILAPVIGLSLGISILFFGEVCGIIVERYVCFTYFYKNMGHTGKSGQVVRYVVSWLTVWPHHIAISTDTAPLIEAYQKMPRVFNPLTRDRIRAAMVIEACSL